MRMCFEKCQRVLFETSCIDNYFRMNTSGSVSLGKYTNELILVHMFGFLQFINILTYQSHNFVCIFKNV